jgi:hypothetical protein
MSAPQAIPSTGYRPRSAPNQLKDLVEEHYEELLRVWEERFRATFGTLHPRLKDLFEEFVRCGDPHFGFLRLRCLEPDCPEKTERIVPFSCKSRGLCPSCGMKRAILWAERMVEAVLPDVGYVQFVFTIPKMLRRAFLFDRSLYSDLCRAAYQATRKFFEAQFPSLKKAVPAMVVAPQSFGSLLNFHPHTHACSSLGVFTRDGVFHAVPDDIDFAPLEELFREEVFRFLLKKEKITEERIELLRSWRRSGFHVNADRRVAQGDRLELERLLQYMERPPVSLERLEYRDDGMVLYRGKYNPSLGRDFQFCSPLEFLAMLVPHVALRFECRIHSYGAISTTIRRELGWVKKEDASNGPLDVVVVEDEDSAFVKLRRRNWARLIRKVYLENPALCPACGKEMKIISVITSPHQDDVIEKILEATGQWDPPWKRERRARGPPRQLRVLATEGEDFSQVSPEGEEEFNQLPSADGDA